jgi:hypothetical protein
MNDSISNKVQSYNNNNNEIINDISSFDSDFTNNTAETSLSKIPDVKDIEFTPKEVYYFRSVHKYFKSIPKNKIKVMLDIINGSSKISLRLLDWFVTRYANKKKISYKKNTTDDNDIFKKFFVHTSYKSQLKAYKKRYFDPFRRRKKFYYPYDKSKPNNKLLTTIGQLNFFQWAFENEVIDYVERNFNKILKEMVKSNKEDKLRKLRSKTVNPKTSKKNPINKQIKVNAKKKINQDHVEIVLSFN